MGIAVVVGTLIPALLQAGFAAVEDLFDCIIVALGLFIVIVAIAALTSFFFHVVIESRAGSGSSDSR